MIIDIVVVTALWFLVASQPSPTRPSLTLQQLISQVGWCVGSLWLLQKQKQPSPTCSSMTLQLISQVGWFTLAVAPAETEADTQTGSSSYYSDPQRATQPSRYITTSHLYLGFEAF